MSAPIKAKREAFFFEKKNQKTFEYGVRGPAGAQAK